MTGGLFNTIGADYNETLRDEGFDGYRDFDELTFLVHPETYFDLTDTLNLELGTQLRDDSEEQRALPLRHRRHAATPAGDERVLPGSRDRHGVVLEQPEVQGRRRSGSTPCTGDPILDDQHAHRNGGYAYLEAFLGRRYSVGVRGDYAEDPFGGANRQRTYSAFATWMPSEFQRLRFQFDEIDQTDRQDDQRFTLQWTAFLGSHSHGFAMR